MATNTPLQSFVTTENTSKVTFANIDPTYTDLVIVISGGSISTAYPRLQFNGDTGSNYSRSEIYVQGAAGSITMQCLTNEPGAYFHTGAFSEYPETITLQINNYSSTSFVKTVFSRYGNLRTSGGGYAAGTSFCTWRNTSAIHSVTLEAASNAQPFAAGMVISLYGIKSGSVKAMGGEVYKDSTYYYHVFRTSGVFETTQNITADYLVIAGGGGGAPSNVNGLGMGGGGAGGLRSTVTATGGGGTVETALSLTAGVVYPVTIGAGAPAGTTNTSAGVGPANGSSSSFGAITTVGGGRGGNQNQAPASGGSGGGDCGDPAGLSPGAGTANQGFAGGNSAASSSGGSGGGGAGAVGGSSTSGNAGGAGGAGVAISALAGITGTGVSNFYAGGGGGGANQDAGGTPAGGAGGAGGGGAGTVGLTNAGSGTANTGSGGGSGGATGSTGFGRPGNGGSGLVIVRYTI